MGSTLIPQRTHDGTIHVLITGFDVGSVYAQAFGRHPVNPSWLIAHSLPEVIHAKQNGGRKISIHVRPQPLRVSYTTVREQVPPLLFSETDGGVYEPNFDIVLHIGVSSTRSCYEMETRAFRDDYYLHDVDGKSRGDGVPSFRDQGAPDMIKTGFAPDAVLEKWQKLAPGIDVRMSTDAGRFLCEYVLFTSLWEYHQHRKQEQPPVTFLHVPPETDEQNIQKGTEVALALIKALAQNMP